MVPGKGNIIAISVKKPPEVAEAMARAVAFARERGLIDAAYDYEPAKVTEDGLENDVEALTGRTAAPRVRLHDPRPALGQAKSRRDERGKQQITRCPQLTSADLAREHGFTARHWNTFGCRGTHPGARRRVGRGANGSSMDRAFRRWWEGASGRLRHGRVIPPRKSLSGGAECLGKTESTGAASRRRTEQLAEKRLRAWLDGSTPSRGARSRVTPTPRQKRDSYAST